MKKLIILLIMLSVLSVCVAAEGVDPVSTGPADTGDLFGVVIVMLLASAMGVAALVTHRTRFEQEDKKRQAAKTPAFRFRRICYEEITDHRL